jgi:hypothetical protein
MRDDMTLGTLIERLDDLDGEHTIYAVRGPDRDASSPAVAALEPDDGSLPAGAEGMAYVLEVADAREVLDVWSQWRDGREPTPDERVCAILYYARNDAHVPGHLK